MLKDLLDAENVTVNYFKNYTGDLIQAHEDLQYLLFKMVLVI